MPAKPDSAAGAALDQVPTREWLRRWQFPLLFAPVVVLLGLWPDAVNPVLRYQYDAAWSEGYRWLIGHWVHINTWHMLMNLAAWCLIHDIFYRRVRWVLPAGMFVAFPLFISLMFHCFHPEIQWYVGLSGLLNGVFAVGLYLAAVARWFKWAVFIGFGFKLVAEVTGLISWNAELVPAQVIIEAHLYGALAGLICCGLIALWGGPARWLRPRSIHTTTAHR